jgi:hypothetical protein
VAYQQTDFTHHMHGRAQKQVERTSNSTFGGIFYPHHTKLRRARRGGVKDFVKVIAINEFCSAAKIFNRCLFAKGAHRPQNSHALRRL